MVSNIEVVYPVAEWRDFRGLTLSGCVENEGDVVSNINRDEAEFFTVYGFTHEGEVFALVDIPQSFQMAQLVASMVQGLTELPIEIYC